MWSSLISFDRMMFGQGIEVHFILAMRSNHPSMLAFKTIKKLCLVIQRLVSHTIYLKSIYMGAY